MYRFVALAAALFAAAAVPALAQQPAAEVGSVTATGPGQGAAANVSTITASVVAVDTAKRTITLKGPRGNIVTLPVGPEVKNFDQIKVGDFVAVRYLQALSLQLKKGGTAMRERVERDTSVTAQPGERPAAGVARQMTVIADVIGVNRKKQTVTLRGPSRTVELKVNDPEQLKLVKVGDQVEATYTEAAAISVEPTPKPAAAKK